MFESPSPGVNLRHPRRLTIRPALRWLARQLAPPTCLLCGAAGQELDEPWGLDLCINCEAACRPVPPQSPPFDASFCLFEYREPVDRLVTGLKFRHELACARVLGVLFARARRRCGQPPPECLVPLPLHPARYRERGFCQTTELARHIARRLRGGGGGPMRVRNDLLRRQRATLPQSSLDAGERAANLQGAFALCTPGPLPAHIALLDDVLTTGHTALAAAQTLKAGGVQTVEVWCCARAVLRRDAVASRPEGAGGAVRRPA